MPQATPCRDIEQRAYAGRKAIGSGLSGAALRQNGDVPRPAASAALPLYTGDQRRRRDQSPWTLVQGVLAPVQFLIFLTSFGLVLHYLATGRGYELATVSIVVKTLALYTIMITGAIWEREVFGVYLFARPFFWEDVFSMLVIALHTAYLAALATGTLSPPALMGLALAAYMTYVINAAQFVLKLRAARLGAQAAIRDSDRDDAVLRAGAPV